MYKTYYLCFLKKIILELVNTFHFSPTIHQEFQNRKHCFTMLLVLKGFIRNQFTKFLFGNS